MNSDRNHFAQLDSRWLVLTVVVFLAHGAVAAQVVADHPDERLARNVAEVVASINDGDPARLQQFVQQRYAESMLQGMSVEDSAGRRGPSARERRTVVR